MEYPDALGDRRQQLSKQIRELTDLFRKYWVPGHCVLYLPQNINVKEIVIPSTENCLEFNLTTSIHWDKCNEIPNDKDLFRNIDWSLSINPSNRSVVFHIEDLESNYYRKIIYKFATTCTNPQIYLNSNGKIFQSFIQLSYEVSKIRNLGEIYRIASFWMVDQLLKIEEFTHDAPIPDTMHLDLEEWGVFWRHTVYEETMHI